MVGTLLDLRRRLVNTLGADEGGRYSELLVSQSVRMLSPYPSFLDLRDGILAANRADIHPNIENVIWEVFANRGMGVHAVDETKSSPIITPRGPVQVPNYKVPKPSNARPPTLSAKLKLLITKQRNRMVIISGSVTEARKGATNPRGKVRLTISRQQGRKYVRFRKPVVKSIPRRGSKKLSQTFSFRTKLPRGGRWHIQAAYIANIPYFPATVRKQITVR